MTLHTTHKGGRERIIATKPYLRDITLQSAHLPALASHLFCVLMCNGASGQSDSLQGRVGDDKGEGVGVVFFCTLELCVSAKPKAAF